MLKVMLVMLGFFGLLFLLGHGFGWLTADTIRAALTEAAALDRRYLFALVIILLFVDLFITVPTLTTVLLAGYFLGFPVGALAGFLGIGCGAATGYWASRQWGGRAIATIVGDAAQREALTTTFNRHGPVMILLARAAPMVPEITACLAGATRMPFWRYVLFFTLGTAPYVLIAAYAGSISSLENPKPAIFASLLLYAVLWTGWLLFRRRQGKTEPAP